MFGDVFGFFAKEVPHYEFADFLSENNGQSQQQQVSPIHQPQRYGSKHFLHQRHIYQYRQDAELRKYTPHNPAVLT